jgi:O-antigen/teichoic acid export membrane protein
VMAIATMVMVGLSLLTDLGLRQNIIQSRRGNDPSFLNTAWVTQIFQGLLLWFAALCVAGLVALANHGGLVPPGSVYADPSLPYVVAVLSASVVVEGFKSTKVHEASRNLALRRVTTIELVAQAAGLLCMLAWALGDRSVWALVAGSLSSALTSAVLSHVWLPGSANRWEWDKSAFWEILHFGKWIFASSILGFLVANGDRLLLGGLVDGTVLGVYVIAFLIFNSFEQVLSRIASSVSFPALSEVARERPKELKRVYYSFHWVFAAFAYVVAGVLMAFGQDLVGLLYDNRYSQAGWMLEVLAVALLIAPYVIAIQCFVALGMPHLLSNITALRLAALLVLTSVGFRLFGLPGAVWGIVCSYFVSLPIIIVHTRKCGLFDLRRELLVLPMLGLGFGAGKLLSFSLRIWHPL